MNSFFKIFIILFMFIGIIGLSLFLHIIKFADIPLDLSANNKIFYVKSGQSLYTISKNLQHENLIKDNGLFRNFANIKGYSNQVKAGEFVLCACMSPKKILEIFVKGKTKLHKLTIPEGYNLKQTALEIEKKGFGTKQDFIFLSKNKKFIKKMGINADSIEGYLFPETYFFEKNEPLKNIIIKMIKRFNIVFTKKWKKKAKKMGFSVHEIVILASIIEKETGSEPERPLISSVFHNRLKKGMRLESDPTVIYGISDYNGNITKKHLITKTSYNTYKIKGLPLGPIANPGAKSLKAALFPANTDYLFFVSKKDKTHKFSKNIWDHNKAVKKYQLNH
ncbi:MAG: aminodeoxychorismate lyase [Desulfobacteraceae bacterium 4572_130]|nr:MAG: aminodeoxychorismate lyase [Desulfobacteraceae bacterium 4572_130]